MSLRLRLTLVMTRQNLSNMTSKVVQA
jgi:hypothetical protein